MDGIDGTAEMSKSQDPRDNKNLAKLVTQILETGELEQEATAQLEQMLRRDDVALQQYLELVDLDARLHWAYRGGGQSPLSAKHDGDTASWSWPQGPKSKTVGPKGSAGVRLNPNARTSELLRNGLENLWRPNGSNGRRRALYVAASLAAALLVWVALHSAVPSGTVGTIAQCEDAQWATPNESLTEGEPIRAGRISLLAGVAEIALYDKTRLIVEGPAELEIVSPSKATVQSGTVSVFVGPTSQGYTVETPDARVVDLGTAFQVRVTDTGTEVHVIEGEVVASSIRLAGKSEESAGRHLTERNAVSIRRTDGSMAAVRFAGEQLKLRGDWPLSAIPEAVTGDIRCLQHAPESVVVGEFEHDQIMMFLEGSDTKLTKTLYADRNAEGEESRTHGNVRMKIPAGARVNSYLLHFDPTARGADDPVPQASGTVRFRSPIVGVFTTGRGLYASDKYLKNPETRYFPVSQDRIGDRGSEDQELITFSPDHKAITVELRELKFADQIRIVTMEEPPAR